MAIKSQHSFTFSYNFIYHHIIQTNEQRVSVAWLFKFLYLAAIKNRYTNTIPLFQGSLHQSFSQRKNTIDCMNNLIYPTVLSDWISKYSKAGPSSAIAADMKVVLHTSWQMFIFLFHERHLHSHIIKFKVIFTAFIFSSWSYWQSSIYLLEFRTQIFSDLFCCAVKTHGTQNKFKTLAMCLFLIWSAFIYVDLLFN